jgi:GT2 family glycosyltransferase
MFKIKKRKNMNIKELIEKSGLFDKVYYLKNNQDVRLADLTPLEHYCRIGIKEDRKPNETFDSVWYKEHYEDIKTANVYPLVHFIKFGIKENRFQSEAEKNEYESLREQCFDSDFYKNSYEDLQKQAEGFDYMLHYIRHGKKEARKLIRFIKNSFVEDNAELTTNKKNYKLLKESDYFDSDYYVSAYNDIREANIDPLEHYLSHGYKEYRNPSELFDTKFYLEKHSDVKEAGINPLVHYLKNGQKEGRLTLPPKEKYVEASSITSLFRANADIPHFETDKPIDIVIPVYNGREYLEPLFQSIVKNTSMPYRLLVCDDKSSDVEVLPLLKKLQEEYKDIDFILLENEQNLGFIGTVNRLSELTQNHFVLLNTDTEVPPFWIERLMYPIFKMQNIASTTPFTNAGTICSFPNYLEDNPIFENMSVEELDSYFQKVNFEQTYIEIPTGVGFCMGVNKELVSKIGMFDTIFGKGYGEENDWCQRAIENGYKNIHVTNLFVYHKHGGSFPSEEKKRLIANNSVILNKKHVDYDKQVQSTIIKNELEILRNSIIFKIESSKNYSTLIFDHSLGGGANHYTDDEIKKRLGASQSICLVQYDFSYSKNYKCKLMYDDKLFTFASRSIFDILEALSLFKFDEIFINSFVSYPNVQDIAKVTLSLHNQNQCKLIVPIHDFFPLCPSYTLLNEKMTYCGIPSDYNECEKCLTRNKGEFKIFESETSIEKWRKSWQKLFDVADEVLCFSNSSKEIFAKAYPLYAQKVIVRLHDISGRYEKIYNPDAIQDELKIGILGGINEAKGAHIIKNLVQYIDDNKLKAKVVLIGDIALSIDSPSFYKTGRYTIEQLPELVKELKITEFLIPSIWPETFSYTTDEIMQLGYPLTVFDLGAPAERVRDYPLGKVISMDKLNATLFG